MTSSGGKHGDHDHDNEHGQGQSHAHRHRNKTTGTNSGTNTDGIIDRDTLNAGKDKVRRAKERAGDKASDAGRLARHNSDNPVIVANSVIVAVLGVALGWGAYRKYSAGQLNWRLAGAWAGAVSLFAAADFFVSQCVPADGVAYLLS